MKPAREPKICEVNPVRMGASRPANGSITLPPAISTLDRRESRRRSNGVKIHGRGSLPATEPKTCEVKIHGKKERQARTIQSVVIGMNQIVAQIVNKLSRGTYSFKKGGSAPITLPEWQAIRKMPSVFKILLTQKIYELAPRRVGFELSSS